MQAMVHDARGHVARLRVALCSPFPQDVEEALPELERAIACMRDLQLQIAGADAPEAGLGRELVALSREIGLARRLTEGGLQLCGGWAAVLAAAAGGYAASGKPVALNPASTIQFEG